MALRVKIGISNLPHFRGTRQSAKFSLQAYGKFCRPHKSDTKQPARVTITFTYLTNSSAIVG